jgi:hypothetical protein
MDLVTPPPQSTGDATGQGQRSGLGSAKAVGLDGEAAAGEGVSSELKKLNHGG